MKASGGVEECEGENERVLFFFSFFFFFPPPRNCEYIVMKFVYILGMYFTKLRLFFHSLPHYQNTFSPLCGMLYSGCIRWLLKHWDSFCMLCFTLSSAVDVLRMHLSSGQGGRSQSVLTWYGREDGDLIRLPVWLIPLNLLF